MSHAFFITGTDTEIGKTTIAAALLHAARARGLSTAAVKPVASGCEQTAEGLRNGDALALWQECTVPLTYQEVNPFAFEPAIAPHLAAKEANQVLNVAALVSNVQTVLARQAALSVVEGAGGWRVPLAAGETLADVAKALKLPVILVVGVRLGCINHALLTAEAIQRDGLSLAGWVANGVSPHVSRWADNLATLHERLPAPCLGEVPYLAEGASAASVAAFLKLEMLCPFLRT